jgi:membrane-bound inhibitor of C-type lysozyme
MLGLDPNPTPAMTTFLLVRRALVLVALGVLAACAAPEKPEEVPSKDTFECTLDGDRWVIRFTEGEARLLTPPGERITLYQIPAASGIRYTNGMLELRGKGMELTLISDGTARSLSGCKPVMVPKEEPSRFPWYGSPPSGK